MARRLQPLGLEVKMNTKRSLGILLEGGIFDEKMRSNMRELIETAYHRSKAELDRQPTRAELGEALGMDRWRLARLLKGLEIIDLFD